MNRNFVACVVLVTVGLFSISSQAAKRPIRAIDIQAGFLNTCALLETGALKCWGYNAHGQLGIEATGDRGKTQSTVGDGLPAVKLGKGRKVVSFSLSIDHTCAVLDDGSAKCWGYNNDGRLGLEDTLAHGSVAGTMGDQLPAINFGTGRTVVQISVGGDHTCALLDHGDVKCWGQNDIGQLGTENRNFYGAAAGTMGSKLPKVNLGLGRKAVKVGAGYEYTCALLDNGDVKCWGDGFAATGSGSTFSIGGFANSMGDNLKPINLGKGRIAKDIFVGQAHACALLDDRSLKCWGENRDGELGLEDRLTRGQMPGTMGDDLKPVDLGETQSPVSVSITSYGGFHSCAVFPNNSVKCWGQNGDGRLGLGDAFARGNLPGSMGDNLHFIYFGKNESIIKVAAGGGHTCGLNKNGRIKCFGDNVYGQLGYGDSLIRGNTPQTVPSNIPYVDLGMIEENKILD